MNSNAGMDSNSEPDEEDGDRFGVGVFSDVPLVDEDGESDDKAVGDYLKKIVVGYQKSEFAVRDGDNVGGYYVGSFFRMAMDYFGSHVESLTLGELMELLLDLYPRKVTMPAEKSDKVIDELVAFWTFCDRVHHIQHAARYAEETAKVRDEFREAMSDPSNFGMAKQIAMMASESGYDISNPKDMKEFMANYALTQLAQRHEPQPPPPPHNSSYANLPLKDRKKMLKLIQRKRK